MPAADNDSGPRAPHPLRLLVIAGEVSGDRYGAPLVRSLYRHAGGRALDLRGLGGPRMAAAGATLVADSSVRAAVGFVDPLRQLVPGVAALVRLRALLAHWRPDAAVLVDYPGVNIPLARLLHQRLGVPVAYYVPPEEFLWSKRGNRRFDRAHRVAQHTDLVLTLHRHDTAFYTTQGCRVRRVGHPLLDAPPPPAREPARQRLAPGHPGPLVALLPASRSIEVSLIWPLLARTAERMVRARPDLAFVLPVATAHLVPRLRRVLARCPELASRTRLLTPGDDLPDPTPWAAAAADLALTKSGSITLELALAGLPQVMTYRVDRATEWIGRHLLALCEADFPFMALPNYLLERPVIPEFKQHQADPGAMAATALELLRPASPGRAGQLAAFRELRRELGESGASDRAAQAVLRLAGHGAQH
jgi:lipid-A-disaccharide synthase